MEESLDDAMKSTGKQSLQSYLSAIPLNYALIWVSIALMRHHEHIKSYKENI